MTSTEERIIRDGSRVIAQDIGVLDRIVDILDVLERPGMLTLTQIVNITGIPKPTSHRLLQALQYHHFVRREGNRYGLGSRLFTYVHSQVGALAVSALARSPMRELALETGLTVLLCVRQGAFRVVIAMEEGNQGSSRYVDIGQVSVIYAGAPSKVLLSWLTRDERSAILCDTTLVPITPKTIVDREALEKECHNIREQGWSLSLGEREPLAFSVAVPIADRRGSVIASLDLTGPLTLYHESAHKAWLDALIQTGRKISQTMEYYGSYPQVHSVKVKR